MLRRSIPRKWEGLVVTWIFFSIYAVATAALALASSRQTSSAKDFALGSGQMNPIIAGLALGACLASSATFVIVPGFVYADGLPALIGFTLPLVAGLGLGLFALAFRFQASGRELGALTIPHWIGARYESDLLRRGFAALNVLNVAYLVLVTVGAAYVMEVALGLPYSWAVLGIVTFVFGYTALGGATAHAWTNSMQGSVMLLVALAIAASGASRLPEVAADLSQTGWIAPESVLFGSWWEVWIVPFVMGLALTTQPHLLAKALYVEKPRDVRITLWIGLGAFAVYCTVLFAGAYARLILGPGVPQDQVMAQYIAVAFPWKTVAAVVSVAILAAAMSTLDGLLVAISASVGNDLFPGPRSLWASRLTLVALGLATIALALSPPRLVMIFGQIGVYGLVVASAGPILAGLFRKGPLDARVAIASAVLGLCLHLGFCVYLPNPGVAALFALTLSVPVALVRPGLAARRVGESAEGRAA